MTYLIDTDWLVSYLNGRTEAVDLLTSLRAEGLAISLITYGEIYDGIYGSLQPRVQAAGFERLLRRVDVLPLTRIIMRRFARFRRELRVQGLAIPDADLLIASTALCQDLTLVSRNLRHFIRVPGIAIHGASSRDI